MSMIKNKWMTQYTIFDAAQSVRKLLFNVFNLADSEYYMY